MIKIRWNYVWRKVREIAQKVIFRKTMGRGPFHVVDYICAPQFIFKELIRIGFQPNYFAYYEKSEIYNLRRLCFINGELWQEHIRIFENEIRGHLEISYEENAQKHFDASTVMELPIKTISMIKRIEWDGRTH